MEKNSFWGHGAFDFGYSYALWGTILGLYIGAIILGIAIAFGNVLIPAVIKQKFLDKRAL